MDSRIADCPNLTDNDRERLQRIEAALPITADVSRADLLLCCLLSPRQALAHQILVAYHALPLSISSHYQAVATGRVYSGDEQPLIFQALTHGRGGRRQLEIVTSGAPVIQDVYPIFNEERRVIAALAIETNMIAHERQRRRNHSFQRAVIWLQDMCMRGELACAAGMSRFGLYDGIYLVDRSRTIIYMSGIASNLFRSAGLAVDMQGQQVSELEAQDSEMVDWVFRTGHCLEERHESDDGRVWIRKALPLRRSPTWQLMRFRLPQWAIFSTHEKAGVDAVLMLLQNATDAVQKQRELNVKSAIIQEIHHRVKNNLQTIAAILRIQARRAKSQEARNHLSDAVNRILSVAVIHEFLSEDEHQPINIRDLCLRIGQQVKQVVGNPDQEVAFTVKGPNIRLPASQATPVAMVINELVLNAMEHGLSGHHRGAIEIELRDFGDSVQVAVQNSGSALPPDFNPQQSSSLGLQIVRTLVTDDLKGELRIESIAYGAAEANGGGATGADTSITERADTSDAGSDEAAGDGAVAYGTQALITFPKRPLKVD
ncbi:MAG TPA: sensor histidine kinase [Caldilineaceae bacterium]|nr:sensor histidine kinase [Caldilineaceae bacterium]